MRMQYKKTMKKFHIALGVADINQSVTDYTTGKEKNNLNFPS